MAESFDYTKGLMLEIGRALGRLLVHVIIFVAYILSAALLNYLATRLLTDNSIINYVFRITQDFFILSGLIVLTASLIREVWRGVNKIK